MKKRTYLSAGLALLIGTLSVHASPGLSDVKSRVLPAVYKSKNGLTQKVEISVKHEGEPSTVTIRLGEQSRKEKLVSGDNVFRIEIPEVSTTRQLPVDADKWERERGDYGDGKTGSPLANEYGAAHAYGYRLYSFPNGNLSGTSTIY